MKEPTTIGQRIAAAVVAHQLGIPTDRAMKLYVQGRELDPSWEQVGEALLRSIASTAVQGSLPPVRGLQIVRPTSEPEKTDPRKDRA
jgi:hypothetical protein